MKISPAELTRRVEIGAVSKLQALEALGAMAVELQGAHERKVQS
jgi:hypothetical protein